MNKQQRASQSALLLTHTLLTINSQAEQAAGGCQPHGDLTPAHADGCAARCFEGVQCRSIIIGGNGHGRQSTALLFRRFFIARSRKEAMAEASVWLALARTYLSAL